MIKMANCLLDFLQRIIIKIWELSVILKQNKNNECKVIKITIKYFLFTLLFRKKNKKELIILLD